MNDKKQPISGDITFIQHHLPPMEAGEYELKVAQMVSIPDDPKEKKAGRTYKFAVYGERFQLKPKEINKVFPPDHSHGAYDNVLPHIVLRRSTLPWERYPGTTREENKNKDVAPWLALLVFDQSDPAPSVKTGKVSDLVPAPLGQLPDHTVSYFSQTNAKSLEDLLDYGESGEDPCQMIDLPLDLFQQVAPSAEELPWLAHTRVKSSSEEEFAVVVANRLPKPGSLTTVHLVSLENLEPLLPTAGQTSAGNGKKQIRLISLKQWSFSALDLPVTFTKLLERLNGGGKEAMLRLQTADPLIQPYFQHGYTAFAHQTRQGDQTGSWYRGPFAPESPSLPISYNYQQSTDQDGDTIYSFDQALHLPARNADALTLFDQSSGLLNVSYSAAWQLGRLLALASKEFSTGLYHWKTELVQKSIGLARKQPNFPSARSRSAYYKQLSAFLSDADRIKKVHQDLPVLPPNLLTWLGRLIRLYGVPSNYLIPDLKMLPPESIRFFEIDPNWSEALLDGALSIGRSTRSAWAHDLAFTSAYMAQIKKEAGITQEKVSGLLLRSAVVKGWWPGMQIDGYNSSEEFPSSTPLTNIRLETLAPGILLCLFDGIASRVNIHEPPEGLHFGLDELDDADRKTFPQAHYKKGLRYLSGRYTEPGAAGSPEIGSPMMADDGNKQKEIAAYLTTLKNGDKRVLDINALATEVQAQLIKAKGLASANEPFTAAEFALQMVEGVQMVGFKLNQA